MTNIQVSYLYELGKILCYIFLAIVLYASIKNSPSSNATTYEQREKNKKLLEDMFKASSAM
ncbi:MAG: hypothetical protein IJ759_06325 [Bacteroidales bacterium]|nr:hypothetical protein [Bacteroidales bacterium]